MELSYADKILEEAESQEEQPSDDGFEDVVIREEIVVSRVSKKVILSYFYLETSVAKIMEIRRQYE